MPKYLDDSEGDQEAPKGSQFQTQPSQQIQQTNINQPINIPIQQQTTFQSQAQTQLDVTRQKLNQSLVLPVQFNPTENTIYQKILSALIMITSFYQALCCILWLFSRQEIIYSDFWYTILLMLFSILTGIAQIQVDLIQNYFDIYFRLLRRKLASCICQLVVVAIFSYEFSNTLGKASSIMMLSSIALIVIQIVMQFYRK